jgi:hypothetical protein
MKHLFEAARAEEVKQRLEQLQPDSQRQWGNMDPAQMLAHCSAAIDMAEGKIVSPRIMIGRLLGPLAKKSLIIKGEPMRRNSKTAPSVIVADERNFIVEKKRLLESIDRFVAGGPAICTGHPHFFFGPLTPEEWASLMYQHLDHHLRQFGA